MITEKQVQREDAIIKAVSAKAHHGYSKPMAALFRDIYREIDKLKLEVERLKPKSLDGDKVSVEKIKRMRGTVNLHYNPEAKEARLK